MTDNDKNKKNGSNNHEEGTKWIVAVVSGVDAFATTTSDQSAGKVMGEIVTLKDPSTGDRRDYAMMKTGPQQETIIVEFQDIPSDFSSFMVGRHIVKDGSLYMMNRVDPLFFYLAAQEHHLQEQQQKKSWQPFEQCFEETSNNNSNKGKMLPKEIHSTITADQLKHLCLTFENDDVVYFRFDVNKALQFLRRKKERVLECLIRQDQIEQRRQEKLYESSFQQYNSGSSKNANSTSTPSKDENGDKKENNNGSSSPAVVISDTKALKLQSIQIVSNYLTEAWSAKFVETLGVTMDQVRNKTPNKSNTKSNDNADTTASTTPAAEGFTIQRVVETDTTSLEATNKAATKAAADKKAIESYRTPGNKRLAKVNTKGMKSIASFFGAAPKSKKAKHS